jgi:purine nucleosidase
VTRRLWIDTDMGFDDIVAIAMVAAARDVDVAGLSLVAGNAPLAQVVRNARDASAFFRWTIPIHAGRARPLVGELVTASYALGESALPTAGRSLPEGNAPLSAASAPAALAAYLEAAPGEIVALGPLSNIAALVIARPELAGRVERLVWMGGSVGPGNHTAAAEFNAFVDPEALQAVIDAGVPIAMVGLDACRPVTVSREDALVVRGAGGARAAVLADLLEGYAAIAHARGETRQPIYDPVAAAAWLDPSLVAFRPARLDAELAGTLTRGMTVVEWRVPRKAVPNAEIATRADAEQIRALIFHALTDAVEQP